MSRRYAKAGLLRRGRSGIGASGEGSPPVVIDTSDYITEGGVPIQRDQDNQLLRTEQDV